MLSAGRGLQLGQTHEGTTAIPWTITFVSGKERWFLLIPLFIFFSLPQGTAWPYDYRHLYNHCPGPEWNVMCRGCCEYDVIRCKCPLQGTPVGYAVPCCRNAINECDPCIIHPGCSVFENCKRCNNGTWGPRDDFFISGRYCAECRPGWSGGDCMKCGGVIRKRQGHLVLESYPNNARCEWTIQVDRPFTIELRFMMLSLELHHSCRYDYVEVRDGDSIRSRVIGRFCGNNRPLPIQSSGNSLHILFVSDGYKNFDGFFATFQESSACSSSPCLHDGTCILDTSYTYHCACLAGYTGKRCENVVGCRRPPVPTHGSTKGLFHHSGARITFHCDSGFQLQGFRSAICLSDGTWSAPAPQCVPVESVCSLPAKPAHGDHFLVYGPNDVLVALQYLCYQPYELNGSSQRTCLPNNTWSGTPPDCIKVNNTLPEAEKEKDNAKETEKQKETDKYTDKDISKTIEKGQENTTVGEETVESTDINTEHMNTTTADREDKYTGTIPEETVAEDRNEGGPEENNTGSEPTGGSIDKVDSKGPDNSLNTVEKQDPEVVKAPEKKEESPDRNVDIEQTDITQIVVIKDKGQEEKERKEEQVNGKRDRDKVGPNDTKMMTVISEGENTVEIFELGMTNNTVTHDERDTKEENNTITLPDLGKKVFPTRVNITQYTMYRAGEDNEPKEKTVVKEEKTKEELEREVKEKEREKEREVNQSIMDRSCPPLPRLYNGYHQVVPGAEPETREFICNHSYALSGDARRSCQPDGTWTGTQPVCVRACREPKVSELVKQKVLLPQALFRKTPLHRLYSSGLGRQFQSDGPTRAPPVLSQLPQGFHHLHTHIEYECASPFYHHSGSARRTCLKTGKWSGRHVSCSPVCGKHPTFDPERPAEAHWPWLAAIYRRYTIGSESKVTKAGSQAGSLKKDGRTGSSNHDQASDWQLVCSGALVNQRSVVVAAHCVTELGKVYPLNAAKVKVVVGKHYRDDHKETKGLQHLRVASIVVHPDYDAHILDSDMAVIKLLDKARISEKVLPLCLSDSQGEEGPSGQGLVTGWSPLADSNLGADEKARVGLVHLADIVPCEHQYARNGVPVSVTENMLCASQKPDYAPSNICPSDTGGILVLPDLSDPQAADDRRPSFNSNRENKGLWRLLGLVSFGYDQGECDPDLYTVYTRVDNFKDWIESNMK